MMTLPVGLERFMQWQDLKGLKPFALLYRNKWNSTTNKYELESTPIDISDLIVKPNTLSMTLDVNEIAQYNANNVTLTLADTKNYFVEGTPNSYFPEGYQLYGSRVVLYYGLDGTNRTPLFTGVIKDLPTHKPEQYQVELKLVSPLEMLKDIEAKDFSDKVTGETLTYKSTDSDGHRIYWTSGTGVGGFDAVYANGTKLFEGVDYETDQLNALGLPAVVKIINSAYYEQAITADYYTWKTGLTVEQIVEGLAGLAGYDSGTEDIRAVSWNTAVRTQFTESFVASCNYSNINGTYIYNNTVSEYRLPSGVLQGYDNYRNVIIPEKFRINFDMYHGTGNIGFRTQYLLYEGQTPITGLMVDWASGGDSWYKELFVRWYQNGSIVREVYFSRGVELASPLHVVILGNGADITVTVSNTQGVLGVVSHSMNFSKTNERLFTTPTNASFNNYYIELLDNNLNPISEARENQLLTNIIDLQREAVLSEIVTSFSQNTNYYLEYRYSLDGLSWSQWSQTNIGSQIGINVRYLQVKLTTGGNVNVGPLLLNILSSSLLLQLVNLSDSTVLESLQDFALISGYEFGVDRQGVFFFRPRVQSTTPQYVLDHDEIVKINTVKKNLNDFFTKLTLTFAERPLEFYANTGDRPTLVDKYGIINKEIDKPDIVNYDNPELAQAIGPQLLETYANLSNTIQVVCKLNLALELGDIVSLQRNFNLVEPEEATDYRKYETQQTFYRACKIIGLNYNFSKRQITYTLRDVTNDNNLPVEEELYEFVYDFPIQLGAK